MKKRLFPLLPGLALVGVILAISTFLVDDTIFSRFGLSSAALGILIGVAVGNVWSALPDGQMHTGIQFAQKHLLRWGIVLFGFHLSLQQILSIGERGIAVDIFMLVSTLALGIWLGCRWFGLDLQTSLLTAVGSAICGAAAVAATAPMLKDVKAEKVTSAVGTVVLFGTLGMGLYPLIDHWGPASLHSVFGVYVGSTVHEVAQVVAIVSGDGDSIEKSAVVVKMLRVLMLMPFLFALGMRKRDGESSAQYWRHMPWFALGFIAIAGVNSLDIVPLQIVHVMLSAGAALLAAGMIGLGLGTTLARIRAAGVAPVLLGGALFIHLVVVGGLVNFVAGRLG